jgi:glutathione synthase/RimK-type ligase-like ATP-grasp enzyme
MAQVDGQNFDVRVVCVYGKPVCSVFRLSSLPMTNLHLGGRRGDWDRCRAAIPTREWLDALDHCAEAAACFDSAVAGVDLLFETGYRRHYVLEVNAFGDFFPGWLDGAGRSVHSYEIEATARRYGFL